MATLPLLKKSDVHSEEPYCYIIGKKIGQGTHATVHLADFINGTTGKNIKLACKIFNKKKAPVNFLNTFFVREIEILTKIDNPHIIQVHSIVRKGPKVFIFMRHAENGDLLEYIRKNGPVPESQSKLWFKQITSGLQYLHKLNIAHRDLKCENILLSKKFHVKLADFGFARYCVDQDGRRVLSQTYCGSAAYAAPEIVANIPYNPKLADVWSLGVILFIMLNAAMPFEELEHLHKLLKDQMNKNWAFRSNIEKTISAQVKNIVGQILEPDITLRLTVDRIWSHEWLNVKKCSYHYEKQLPFTTSTQNQDYRARALTIKTCSGLEAKNQPMKFGQKSFKHNNNFHPDGNNPKTLLIDKNTIRPLK